MRNALRVLSILAIVVMGVGVGLYFALNSRNDLMQIAAALGLAAGALLGVAAFVVGVVAAARRQQTGWLVGLIVAAVASVPLLVLGPIAVGVVGLVYSYRMREAA